MAEPGTRPAVSEQLAAMWLASPALPIGAFAYSGGLEQAVELGWVHDRASCESWVAGVLGHAVARFDLPLLARLWVAWAEDDQLAARHLDARVLAGRESAELQAAELALGTALLRVLDGPEPARAEAQRVEGPLSYVAAFALAAVHLGIDQPTALASYCFAWIEHSVGAATRLVPLGQSDAQRVLRACLRQVPDVLALAATISDDAIGAATPGLAIASARHETQYSRLFRS